MSDCLRYLDALFAVAHGSVELRWPTQSGMGRAFYGTSHLAAVAAHIARLALSTDVFVGVLPRQRQASKRDDVATCGRVLWVDCDSPRALVALQSEATPSVLVASGTGDNRHAYWLLRAPVAIDIIEAANRALAERLGADLSATDAARILRPPSRNHKHTPATTVCLLQCDPRVRYDLGDLVEVAGLEMAPRYAARPQALTGDPLHEIEPALYVELLTGVPVPRSGKIACPFHQDDTPSLHVYGDAARGWYCYGCRRGGSVFDFAAALWGMAPRGAAFHEIRERLELLLRERNAA